MTFLRFDRNGIHFAEMFQQQGVTGLLPGAYPDDTDEGDEWDEELVREFPHLSEEG